jgi:hypothetical protein
MKYDDMSHNNGDFSTFKYFNSVPPTKLDKSHADITSDKFISLKFIKFRSYIPPVIIMENTNQFYNFMSISMEHGPFDEINSSSARQEIP